MNKRALAFCVVGAFILATLILTIRVYHVAQDPAKYGIIILKEWEHGVALCQGDEPDEDMVTQEGEFHMWQKDGIMYTINYGHMDEVEVNILVASAMYHCEQFNK